MKCRCCSTQILDSVFSATILNITVNYYDCPICGYVQTQDPTWLDDAYKNSINDCDTGIMRRNYENVSRVLGTLRMLNALNSKVVDYAGGYGVLVRLLRDIGLDAYWADPYSSNLHAKGFEYCGQDDVALVCSFEAFEHFTNPCDQLQKLLSIGRNVLISTELISSPPPQPKDWWYYGTDHGQHIGFYRIKTLKYIAKKFGLNLLSDGVSLHLFTSSKHNYLIWKCFMKISKIVPRLFLSKLVSRTWSDYLTISKYGTKD